MKKFGTESLSCDGRGEKMKCIELFAGIGGFRVACDELQIQTIWANDIDAKASKVYRDRFGEDIFIEMGFSYQQRVRNWLAAYMDLNVSVRVGTELQSILTQGFSAITSF
ncbi:hypothetical protein LCGC14_1462210, partial [marine sediment metagenome]